MSKQAKLRRIIPVSVDPGQSDVPQNLCILYRPADTQSDKWLVLDEEKKSVTLAFASKPASSLISRMNAAGFSRSMRGDWCWTKRQNAASLAFASRLVGVQVAREAIAV